MLLACLGSPCQRERAPAGSTSAPATAAQAAKSSNAPVAPSSAAPDASTSAAPGIESDIRQLTPNHYVVSRKLFDFWTRGSGPEYLERSSKVEPVEENGRTVGVRLTRLKPTGWLSQLGFVDGDVVVDVNGEALSSAARFMELYAQERKQTSFKVGVLRAAQRVELAYDVR